MQQTQSSLVRGITDFGDHQRWFEFHQMYRPMICKILLDKGLRPEELDDAVQEVYVSMLSTIQRFRYDRDRGKFRSWLSRITHRTAIAYRRRSSVRTATDPRVCDEAESDPTIDPGDDCTRLCLQLARSRFDEKTWLPFYLRVLEEVPIEEVQRITQMNRNAIYQAVFRVKACLREMLAYFDDRPDR